MGRQLGPGMIRRGKEEEEEPFPSSPILGKVLLTAPRYRAWLKGTLCFTDGETEAKEQEAATLQG